MARQFTLQYNNFDGVSFDNHTEVIGGTEEQDSSLAAHLGSIAHAVNAALASAGSSASIQVLETLATGEAVVPAELASK